MLESEKKSRPVTERESLQRRQLRRQPCTGRHSALALLSRPTGGRRQEAVVTLVLPAVARSGLATVTRTLAVLVVGGRKAGDPDGILVTGKMRTTVLTIILETADGEEIGKDIVEMTGRQ